MTKRNRKPLSDIRKPPPKPEWVDCEFEMAKVKNLSAPNGGVLLTISEDRKALAVYNWPINRPNKHRAINKSANGENCSLFVRLTDGQRL